MQKIKCLILIMLLIIGLCSIEATKPCTTHEIDDAFYIEMRGAHSHGWSVIFEFSGGNKLRCTIIESRKGSDVFPQPSEDVTEVVLNCTQKNSIISQLENISDKEPYYIPVDYGVSVEQRINGKSSYSMLSIIDWDKPYFDGDCADADVIKLLGLLVSYCDPKNTIVSDIGNDVLAWLKKFGGKLMDETKGDDYNRWIYSMCQGDCSVDARSVMPRQGYGSIVLAESIVHNC